MSNEPLMIITRNITSSLTNISIAMETRNVSPIHREGIHEHKEHYIQLTEHINKALG